MLHEDKTLRPLTPVISQ